MIRQCNLKEEKKNQAAFKEALEQTEQTVRLDTLLATGNQINLQGEKITEAVDADNLLIMEHLQDGHALNTLINPENQQLRSEVYQRCFGVNLVDDDLFKSILDKVHFQVKEKWCELALGHGIVHGDCHPDNIMLSFKPDGHIDVWFNDFGNCITLTEAQRTQYPDTAHLLSNTNSTF